MTVAKSAAGALLNGVHVEMGQLLHRARKRATECVGQRAVRECACLGGSTVLRSRCPFRSES